MVSMASAKSPLRDAFLLAFDEAAKKHERLFMSAKHYQNPEAWLVLLGEALKKVQHESLSLTPDKIQVENVMELISYVGAMTSIVDFFIARFGGFDVAGD